MITPDLRRALTATAFFGASAGIFQATLNNYLAEVHHLDALARGWLELPRELPGFLLAGAIAVVGFLVCLRIKVPIKAIVGDASTLNG